MLSSLVLVFCAVGATHTAVVPDMKWGQDEGNFYLSLKVKCAPGTRVLGVEEGDKFHFACKGLRSADEYSVKMTLRTDISEPACRQKGDLVHCSLPKKEPHIDDRLTYSEEESVEFGTKLIHDDYLSGDQDGGKAKHKIDFGMYKYDSALVEKVSSDESFRNILANHVIVVADVTQSWCKECSFHDAGDAFEALKGRAKFIQLNTLVCCFISSMSF